MAGGQAGNFPWRDGNQYQLFVDGEAFFPRMFDAVAAAREQVVLHLYMFESGSCGTRWIQALQTAAERGVQVLVLIDDLGSMNLSRRDRDALRAGGVSLATYNPLRFGRGVANFLRDHRKLLLIDGEIAFVGGFCFGDDFDPESVGEKRWHDVAVEIRGPCVGDWWQMFVADWERWSGDSAPRLPSRNNPSAGRPGRVAVNRVGHHRETRRGVHEAIAAAEQRVWIATAYFFPPRGLRRALRHAARRGVDVRLLLAGPETDQPGIRRVAHGFYGRLLRDGVRVYEFEGRCLHAKLALCDDWSSVGSSNLDHWTLRWTRDANQESRCPDLAQALEAFFRHDFAEESSEIDSEQWRQRSWSRRLVERLAFRLHVLVTYLSFRRMLRSETRRRRKERRSEAGQAGGST